MIITEIEINNFRIYKGKNRLELNTSEDKNITLISGKNGFGKTTFLMSLVWCLYGRQMQDVDELYDKEIKENGGYAKYIANSLNTKAKSEGETEFSVSITFTDVNIPDVQCNELTVIRKYSANKVSNPETITILIDGYENELAQDVGPEIFVREFIMPQEIAKFFFFDAEKIVSLAEISTAQQRKSLSLAYSEVLGIKKYEDIRAELEGVMKKLRADSAGRKEKDELSKLKMEVENHQNNINENQNLIKELEEYIASLTLDSNKIQEKLVKNGSTITVEELNKLREQSKEYDEKIYELNEQLKHSYEIIPFAMVGSQLNNIIEQLEEEHKYKNVEYDHEKIEKITRNIINDLINETKPKDLVIEHDVQEFFVNNIRNLIKKHFIEQETELPKSFKELHNFSDSEKNEFNEFVSQIKLSFKESFKRISSDYNEARNEQNAIKRKIREAEENKENPIIAADRQKKEEIDKEISEKQKEIGALKKEIEDNNNEIIQKNKNIDSITDKLEVSKKNEQKYKTTEKTKNYLTNFIKKFKEEKRKSLENQIYHGLTTLMHKKGYINKVEVEIIDENIDINLYDANNNEIDKGNLSKGEKQMYATALLKGLVEESYIKFPVFIDSPMQKFDVDHAYNIVKYFYPQVSEQVVLFPLIKKEMTSDEYNIILPYLSNTYLLSNSDNYKTEFISTDANKLFEEFEKMTEYAD